MRSHVKMGEWVDRTSLSNEKVTAKQGMHRLFNNSIGEIHADNKFFWKDMAKKEYRMQPSD